MEENRTENKAMEQEMQVSAQAEPTMQEEAYKSGSVQYIDSREVAKIVEKNHRDVMRDIRRYCKQLKKSIALKTTSAILRSLISLQNRRTLTGKVRNVHVI